jgi:hypothetical protein
MYYVWYDFPGSGASAQGTLTGLYVLLGIVEAILLLANKAGNPGDGPCYLGVVVLIFGVLLSITTASLLVAESLQLQELGYCCWTDFEDQACCLPDGNCTVLPQPLCRRANGVPGARECPADGGSTWPCTHTTAYTLPILCDVECHYCEAIPMLKTEAECRSRLFLTPQVAR